MNELMIRRSIKVQKVQLNEGVVLAFGGTIGLLPFESAYFLIAPLFCFFLIRSKKESIYFTLSLAVVNVLMYPSQYLELTALLLVIFLWFQWTRVFHIVTSDTLGLLLPITTGIIAYFSGTKVSVIVLIMAIEYVFAKDIYDHFNWLKKELKLPPSIYGMIIFALGVFSIISFPTYPLYFSLIMFTLLLFIAKVKTTLLLYLLFIAYFQPILPIEVFGALLILYTLSTKGYLMNIFMIVLGMQMTYSIENVLIGATVFILFNLLRISEIPFEELETSKDYLQLNKVALMNRQLNNFSIIFDHLADYYTEISEMESEVLKSMAKALSYTASYCTHHSIDSDVRMTQLLDLLDGYKIIVEDCRLQEDDQGCIHLDLDLKDFKKQEVTDTLIPLLNHILPTKMELVDKKQNRVYSGIYSYSFVSCAPIQIDAYADSITHEMSACGDSFSIFRYASNVLCMISDGMGSGSTASKISTNITAIFQRMVASGIPQIEAIRCINKLIQSDQYATMDVLSFDRYRKSVTVCKSAACPTFLIRQSELYEINGSSLPVGIVASIEVDSVSVEVEKDDWFLMASDGVYIDEIYRWIHTKRNLSAKDEVNTMMNILKETRRKDDSTFLLAHVI